MRRARRGVDWGVVFVLAFALLAAWWSISQPDLARTYEGEHAVYQTATFAVAIAEGRLYPRWQPDALGGYGAPIPHYYPSGSALLAAYLQFFITGDPISAIRLLMIMLTLLGSGAVYALAARHVGGAGGVLAAVLFLYNPIIGVTVPSIMGDLAIHAGIAYTAALWWSMDRMIAARRPLDGLAAVGAVAALMLTHVGIAVVGMALALFYALGYVLRRGNLRLFLAVISRMGIGVGIAACFWLPALLEQEAVRWLPRDPTLVPMLTLNGLIAFPRPIDPNALIPTPEWGLGVPIWVCTALTIGAWFTYRTRAPAGLRFAAFWLGAGAALIGVGVGIAPAQTWIAGLIALCMALGGAGAMAWYQPREEVPSLIKRRAHRLIMPFLIALALAFALPLWLSPPQTTRITDSSGRAQVEYERLGFGIAALSDHAPIPTTLTDLTFNRELLTGYESGAIIKLHAVREDGRLARIGLLLHSTHGDSFQIGADGGTAFDVLTADFPGWTATLNNQPIQLERAPSGLMRVTLGTPASGTLIIRLETTPIRSAAWGLTGLMIVLALLVTIRAARSAPPDTDMSAFAPPTPFETRLIAVALLIFALIVVIVPLAAARLGSTFAPAPGYRLQDTIPIRARTDDGLELLAFRAAPSVSLRAGDSFALNLIWRAARTLPANNRARVLLLNRADGTLIPLADAIHPGGVPTRRWTRGLYVDDPRTLHLPRDLPAGEYSPAVDVLLCTPTCTLDARPYFFAGNGAPLGYDVVLPIILRITES
jgi:hypothetical protein